MQQFFLHSQVQEDEEKDTVHSWEDLNLREFRVVLWIGQYGDPSERVRRILQRRYQ